MNQMYLDRPEEKGEPNRFEILVAMQTLFKAAGCRSHSTDTVSIDRSPPLPIGNAPPVDGSGKSGSVLQPLHSIRPPTAHIEIVGNHPRTRPQVAHQHRLETQVRCGI